MRRIVVFFIVVLIVLVGLLSWKLFEQYLREQGPPTGSGTVEGTEVRLTSRLNARVIGVLTEEGNPVQQDDLLVTLDCTEAEAGLAEARAQHERLEAQATAASAAARQAKHALESTTKQSFAALARARALDAQRDTAKRQAERLQKLGEDAAEAARDQAQAQAEDLANRYEAARLSAAAAEKQVQAVAEQKSGAVASAEAAQKAVAAAKAAVKRAEILVAECEVHSPRDAYVETIYVEPGELAMPGTSLVKLVSIGQVKAVFYVPNADLRFVQPGQEAEVVADAYPEQVFLGTVNNVAHEAEFTPRNVQTRSDRDRLVYPVEVQIDNREGKLRPGMPVEVTLRVAKGAGQKEPAAQAVQQ